MGRRLRLEPHLAVDELERRYRAAKEPHERSWWQMLWLLAKGHTAAEVAESTGYSRYWIGQLVRRYNVEGPEAMRNRRYTHSHRATPLLPPALLAELACRRMRLSRRPSKKAPSAPPGSRNRLPQGQRRALGGRRAPDRPETDSAQSVVF